MEKNNETMEAVYDASTLGTPRMLVLGMQHLFAMFGATVLVPVITGLNVSTTLLFAGLGTLLFYRLLQREREVGSRYMSIFTGVNNRAKEIYMKAGFRVVRTFAVMRKEL